MFQPYIKIINYIWLCECQIIYFHYKCDANYTHPGQYADRISKHHPLLSWNRKELSVAMCLPQVQSPTFEALTAVTEPKPESEPTVLMVPLWKLKLENPRLEGSPLRCMRVCALLCVQACARTCWRLCTQCNIRKGNGNTCSHDFCTHIWKRSSAEGTTLLKHSTQSLLLAFSFFF